MSKTNLPVAVTGAGVSKSAKTSAFLEKIRAAKAPARVVAPRQDLATLIAAAIAPSRRPRLVLAVDATASRGPAWEAAKQVTDALFSALPGQLDVALAVHGGTQVHTFTDFVTDAAVLRDRAASIRCRSGETRMLDILDRVLGEEAVKVVVYIGDVFEESREEGLAVADKLKLRGTRLIVLHDTATGGHVDAEIFARLAERTGGCVLPFNAAAIDLLGELLGAIAVLAVGGVKLLEAKAKALPAARLLLEHLSGK